MPGITGRRLAAYRQAAGIRDLRRSIVFAAEPDRMAPRPRRDASGPRTRVRDRRGLTWAAGSRSGLRSVGDATPEVSNTRGLTTNACSESWVPHPPRPAQRPAASGSGADSLCLSPGSGGRESDRIDANNREGVKATAVMSELESVIVDGVRIFLGSPIEEIPPWVGQREVLIQLLAAWSRIEEERSAAQPEVVGQAWGGQDHSGLCRGPRVGSRDLHRPRPPWTPVLKI